MKKYFVTGIGTEIGKTLVAAILVEKLQADYWKPVQSGDLDHTDTQKVKRLISNSRSVFHPETYRLTQPFSPHKSAALDGVTIRLEKFSLPETKNHLIVEGAGGLMVPLNDDDLMIDLIAKLDVEVILVSRNYLGSINHTPLSATELRRRNIPVKGIIFNGDEDEASEKIIHKISMMPVLGRVPQMAEISLQAVAEAGNMINL